MDDRYGFRPGLIRPNQNATFELSCPQGVGGSNSHGEHHIGHGIHRGHHGGFGVHHGGIAHSTVTHTPPHIPVRPPHHNPSSQNRYHWKHWSVGEPVPDGAIRGGTDCDGTAIYVGRGFHNGDQIPAKVIPEKSAIYVAWGGDEVFLSTCELLCQQQFSWIHASNGEVPYGAIVAGHTNNGEPLYVARVYHEGSHCVGKLHPSHGTCYIPFGGKEHAHSHYEVLVLRE